MVHLLECSLLREIRVIGARTADPGRSSATRKSNSDGDLVRRTERPHCLAARTVYASTSSIVETLEVCLEPKSRIEALLMSNETRLAHGPVLPSNQGEKDMELSRDPKEGRDNTPLIALAPLLGIIIGGGLGIALGAVVFAITQNPIWIGMGMTFGAGLGLVVGAALQANRR